MNFKSILIIVATSLALTGCEQAIKEHNARTADNDSNNNRYNVDHPQFVVHTQKGDLYRIYINRNGWVDSIYYFNNVTNQPISVIEPQGKFHKTIVIDGDTYIKQ